MTPEQLLYASTHEWVSVETDASGEKIATVGISAFALEALSDPVNLELPEPGDSVTAGGPFGEIESVKSVSDMYSPVDGQIVEVNQALLDPDNLERLPEDPYDNGWLVKIKITDASGLANLLDHAAYRKQCEAEELDH